jgi:hypothetical protein
MTIDGELDAHAALYGAFKCFAIDKYLIMKLKSRYNSSLELVGAHWNTVIGGSGRVASEAQGGKSPGLR